MLPQTTSKHITKLERQTVGVLETLRADQREVAQIYQGYDVSYKPYLTFGRDNMVDWR